MTTDQSRAQRRLAAILAADVVGFSALMGKDEEGTHRQVKSLEREIIAPAVEQHRGRVVKTTGDGFLIDFPSPVEAVRCALSIQKKLVEGPLQLRIGINLGDVIIEQDGDVYGEGVNVAARLEALCDPGGVLVSGKVYDEVESTTRSRGRSQRRSKTAASSKSAGPNAGLRLEDSKLHFRLSTRSLHVIRISGVIQSRSEVRLNVCASGAGCPRSFHHQDSPIGPQHPSAPGQSQR